MHACRRLRAERGGEPLVAALVLLALATTFAMRRT
jgi:hypothetical protein